METVDARGLSCPQPVLKTKQALQNKPDALRVLLDSKTAEDNVLRFLNNSGYQASVQREGDTICVNVQKL